jgi:hypothetical protein
MNVNGYVKCQQCANLDREKSNANWNVCPVMPIAVLVERTSNNCVAFKPIEENQNDKAT